MAITLGTVVVRSDGRLQRAFVQSAATADEVLVADPVDGRVVVYDFCAAMSAAGTLLLEYGTAASLAGPFTLATGTPLRLDSGGSRTAALQTPESESVTITTTVGFAAGYIVYDIET
jgi:hypothetical protein